MTDKYPISKIDDRLEELKQVPSRNPQQESLGRARFLNEAAKYQQAVSPSTHSRQIGWKYLIRKEKLALNTLISIILASAMILGGGVTVVAAQDDLPNQSLYPVKLWTENTRLALTENPDTKANLLMDMAQTRVNEISELKNAGITPPEKVYERLEQQTQQTLVLTSNMDDAALTRTLTQLRQQLQTQEQIMAQLQNLTNADTDPLLTQTRQMLQNCLQLADQGLTDPQGFRYTIQNQMQYSQDEGTIPTPNQQQSQNGQSNQGTEAPNNGNGPFGDQPSSAPQDSNNGNGNGDNSPGGQGPGNFQGGNNGTGGSGGK